MQRMFEHITGFVDLMRKKGYDGNYQSTFGFNDKLKDNLVKHVFQCFEENKNIGPLNLTTYSHWTEGADMKSPHVRCNFYTDFSEARGFEVLKMNIEYGKEYGVIRKKELSINSNSDIPDCEQANRVVMEKKRGMKI